MSRPASVGPVRGTTRPEPIRGGRFRVRGPRRSLRWLAAPGRSPSAPAEGPSFQEPRQGFAHRGTGALKRGATFQSAHVVDLHAVVALDASGGAAFAQESLHDLRIACPLRKKNFNRDTPIQLGM